MRGAPARAIQKLADASTSRRPGGYMHLRASPIEGAIRLLDEPVRGEMGETWQLR